MKPAIGGRIRRRLWLRRRGGPHSTAIIAPQQRLRKTERMGAACRRPASGADMGEGLFHVKQTPRKSVQMVVSCPNPELGHP
jgi:hypothetical protein